MLAAIGFPRRSERKALRSGWRCCRSASSTSGVNLHKDRIGVQSSDNVTKISPFLETFHGNRVQQHRCQLDCVAAEFGSTNEPTGSTYCCSFVTARTDSVARTRSSCSGPVDYVSHRGERPISVTPGYAAPCRPMCSQSGFHRGAVAPPFYPDTKRLTRDRHPVPHPGSSRRRSSTTTAQPDSTTRPVCGLQEPADYIPNGVENHDRRLRQRRSQLRTQVHRNLSQRSVFTAMRDMVNDLHHPQMRWPRWANSLRTVPVRARDPVH